MSTKVFIAEDETDLLDAYVDALEFGGCDVVGTAQNGGEAVEKFAKMAERPNVLFMDYRMPIKNGIDAAKEILIIDPNANIILASADQRFPLLPAL